MFWVAHRILQVYIELALAKERTGTSYLVCKRQGKRHVRLIKTEQNFKFYTQRMTMHEYLILIVPI